jgi:hypothetical protein
MIPTKELMLLGLGTSDPRTIIQGWFIRSQIVNGLILNVLIANLPQIILSTIYYTYNCLFTCFSLGYEWHSYVNHRRSLRVSTHTCGAQCTTYFLQLPYRFAVPLMASSGILHWLCS